MYTRKRGRKGEERERWGREGRKRERDKISGKHVSCHFDRDVQQCKEKNRFYVRHRKSLFRARCNKHKNYCIAVTEILDGLYLKREGYYSREATLFDGPNSYSRIVSVFC